MTTGEPSNPTPTRTDAKSEPRRLTPRELEQLADRLIELMKREVRLDREREGKTR